jgi:hypothetical protein
MLWHIRFHRYASLSLPKTWFSILENRTSKTLHMDLSDAVVIQLIQRDNVSSNPYTESHFYFSTFGWMSCIFLSISFLILNSVSVLKTSSIFKFSAERIVLERNEGCKASIKTLLHFCVFKIIKENLILF